ncbi:MAG TPA: SUMF1/EgtB/PvdO family nonheme iron enzyme [Polyangiaceae bacterium]
MRRYRIADGRLARTVGGIAIALAVAVAVACGRDFTSDEENGDSGEGGTGNGSGARSPGAGGEAGLDAVGGTSGTNARGGTSGRGGASGASGAAGDSTGETCGDGALDDGESCDDRNRDDGDGCDSACSVERGFRCSGEPSDCVDIDECEEGTDDCGAHANCLNRNGGFDCRCQPGYAGDGRTCTLAPRRSCSDMAGDECGGDDCCASLPVAGGSFPFGRGSETCSTCSGGCPSGVSCDSDETPEHTATIASFELDKYEVTVGRFRRFVAEYDGTPPAAGAGAHPRVADTGWRSEWNALLPADSAALATDLTTCETTTQCMDLGVCGSYTWTAAPGPNEERPINCVSWYEAFAFCIWDGARLPTEAEFEFAAGGNQNYLYPWGNSPAAGATLAVYQCLADGTAGCAGLADLPSVGSRPLGAGPFGHLDLLGSVGEWQFDLVSSYAAGACTDCVNADVGTQRSNRGGGWFLSEFLVRTASRHGRDPSGRPAASGLRCARLP